MIQTPPHSPKKSGSLAFSRALFSLAIFGAVSNPALAQSFYTEQGKLIRAPQAVGALGADLFGDKINYYTGGLEFIHTDVSLPGNNALPVSIGRRLVAGGFNMGGGWFGQWDLEIPHLHGIFSQQAGWVSDTSQPKLRCSQFAKPPMVGASFGTSGLWAGVEYWHGSFLYVPGSGDQELLRRSGNPHVPTDGDTYPVVTSNLWAVKCLPSLASDTSVGKVQGEGFLAISPEGTQYRFDWMVSRAKDPLEKGSTAPQTNASSLTTTTDAMRMSEDSVAAGDTPAAAASPEGGSVLARKEVWILPTMVTDRYGNTVTYNYDPANPWQLQSIVSSDQRTISLGYWPGSNRVASVSDGTRTWTYSYDGTGALASLDTVTLPDSSQWRLLGVNSLLQDLQYLGPPRCNDPGTLNPAVLTGGLIHPSGAIGEFTLTATLHARAGVYLDCRNQNTVGEFALNPKDFATNALTKKSIRGPGLTTMEWITVFPPSEGSWAPCSGCVQTKTVEVRDPAGDTTRYTFGTLYKQTEGQLLRTEVVDASNGSLRSTVTRYRDPAVGPFPDPMGFSDQGRGDGEMASRLQVVEQRTISQQGIDFDWKVNEGGIDTMGRATNVTRSSTLGSRTEETFYNDSLGKWILGQVDSVVTAGTESLKNEYDPITFDLISVSHFGRPDHSMTYYPDGTLKTRSDGANHTTTFSNYYRGLARNVDYAGISSESVVVNNIGLITSHTDPVGNPSSYEYDPAGRLHRISRPAGSVTWADTVIDFAQAGASEYGLDPTHWRQTVTTGNATTVTYMDALWRPVLTRVFDAGNEGATRTMVARQFDHRGKTTYESYPQRSIGYATDKPAGVSTEYDGLGRPLYVRADSELGLLTTTFDYLAGFQKRVTNPRGFASTTSYQAFDEPKEEAAVSINAPEQLTVAIARDIFSKPLAVTKSGGGFSATRSYVYDLHHRLCKTIEPETGATIQSYDSANNIAWRASGLTLTGPVCDNATVAEASKTKFVYDDLNRLTSTTYGDGSPGITRTYYADGMPWTVISNGATWTTAYNERRQPITEVLSFEGLTYTLGRSYDGLGNLTQFRYPTAGEGNPITGNSVTYFPNALGQPSQVGGFATGVTYHPNGAIAGFTYGNGKVRSLTQNTRQLPEVANDAGVLQDRYIYDENANVAAIADQLAGNVGNRTLGYDGLDRLKTTSAPAQWGSALYDYDVLDNIRTSTVGNRVSSYSYDSTNRLKTLSSTVPGYGFTYGYDVQGNITNRGTQNYSFDQANRLTAATGKATYSYDGSGHRVKSTAADGTVTISVYSPAGQLLYVTGRGGPRPASTTEYIYLHNHQVAEVKR